MRTANHKSYIMVLFLMISFKTWWDFSWWKCLFMKVFLQHIFSNPLNDKFHSFTAIFKKYVVKRNYNSVALTCSYITCNILSPSGFIIMYSFQSTLTFFIATILHFTNRKFRMKPTGRSLGYFLIIDTFETLTTQPLIGSHSKYNFEFY